ncbi:TetR/AcrR family transcriptional regulator [Photobacterium damselae]|uniref:TetR/AcrR family transcriptional regulator n=1 Tax=Photobacterium damselae TaxID=38293 RepID=UPI001EDD5464|nr:TetR/AcrR family transcriptional regulator [Photobacterium damselae]
MNDKKERILQATEMLLAKHGFHGLSMQKVAQEAGVAAGTIYRYFADKDDLLYQLHDHILGYVAQKIVQGLNDDMSLKQQFRTIWLNIWNMAINGEVLLINQGQFEHLPRRNSSEQRLREKKLFAKIDQMFDQGKEVGLFKRLDNDILSVLSLEPSACLARKKMNGMLDVSPQQLEAAIEAAWDAIVQH